MKKVVVVLDTNILLDNPKAFLNYKKNDIVIPYKVIEELEKHKSDSGEIGLNARTCSRTISELLKNQTKTTLKSGVKLEDGNKLFVVPTTDFKPQENIPLQSGDDHILTVCVGISEEWKNTSTLLISNDTLLRIRANSFGIKCETFNSDTVIQSKEDLYTGYKVIKVDDSILSKYWESKGNIFNINIKELTKEKLFNNDFILLTNGSTDTKKKPYPLLRVKENSHKKKELHFVFDHKLGNKFKPANIEQTMANDLLMDPSVNLVTLTGKAGSGKTLQALATSLEQVVDRKTYKKLIVIRPIHSVGKEIGFLPGDEDEKLLPWTEPIRDNLKVLYGKENIDYLTNNGTIEIQAMSFVRGRSISDAIILVDETQNCSTHEIKTILTRVGKNTKVILTGDIEQIDRNDVDSISNGLSVVVEKFKEYSLAGHCKFNEGLRSPLADLAAEIL